MVIIHHVTYKKEPNSFKNSLFPPSQTHKPFDHYPGHHRLNKNFNIRVHLSYMIQDRVDLKANGCQLPGGREGSRAGTRNGACIFLVLIATGSNQHRYSL